MPAAGVPVRAEAAAPLLEAHIAAKRHRGPDGGAVEVVRDLRLSLARGEFVCLIGPSGCGKTTTLRVLTGLDRDFDGVVRPDPRTLSIGIVFQEPRLLPWRTVEENIRLALPRAQRRRDLGPLLAACGLAAHAGAYPHALSLGLARRVALARALAGQPDLLVLDEPFVSLDARAASDLRQHVRRAAEDSGTAVLMVTHDVREALALADRLVLLGQQPGRVIGEMTPDRPRGARDPDWIERRRADLAARYPMLRGP
ncbi:ATP-binding cassette domain-containing protein [Xanthobacter sp. V4C-4]|uniref:ABC transporter ATP-binding protein n=1 Tax=Xanthobacter cornucopiae TaxID=3119924 RepID=UPI00372CAD36